MRFGWQKCDKLESRAKTSTLTDLKAQTKEQHFPAKCLDGYEA